MPFSWARCLFRGVSAALAARCYGDRIYSRGIVAGLESGSEWRTGGQIAGMKKPARGGLVLPGVGFLVCLISTRLSAIVTPSYPSSGTTMAGAWPAYLVQRNPLKTPLGWRMAASAGHSAAQSNRGQSWPAAGPVIVVSGIAQKLSCSYLSSCRTPARRC